VLVPYGLRNLGNPFRAPYSAEEVRWLADEDVVDLLEELPKNPMMVGREGLRLSLAGAQDKVPVVFDGTRIGLPLNGAASSHILKPAIASLEDTVSNEAFCMNLASVMGLGPAPAHIHTVRDITFLLVERYDRVRNEAGELERVHQEDFCQALGVAPEIKYQNEGGPSFAQCFDLIRETTIPSAPHLIRLFDYAVFNSLVGNHDAHAKNFSLLYVTGDPVLAPLYDVVSTAVYPNLTEKMAMKVGRKYKFSDVYARHWEEFAQTAGLSSAQARKRILRLATELPGAAQALFQDPHHVFASKPIVSRIVGLIENRCGMAVTRLR
jgi:serine/threonine-protein kinase HipA